MEVQVERVAAPKRAGAKVITLTLTDDQFELLHRAGKASGMTTAKMIRGLLVPACQQIVASASSTEQIGTVVGFN